MTSVREHYDRVLGKHYSRTLGDFAARVDEQRALLGRLGITAPRGSGVAVDLGCGPGVHAIALAQLGFRVLAIDFCPALLAELNERARGLPVRAIAGDIRDVAALAPAGVEVAVCMGDTLSHLERVADVERLFAGAAARLAPGGRLVLTFRELARELGGLDRAIPVWASDDLVVTCFLEYEPAAVVVHDLVWAREREGWSFRKGAYRKLRLGADAVAAALGASGFTVERREAPGGMVALSAAAPGVAGPGGTGESRPAPAGPPPS
jgi:SAM-dependent methyltransferase